MVRLQNISARAGRLTPRRQRTPPATMPGGLFISPSSCRSHGDATTLVVPPLPFPFHCCEVSTYVTIGNSLHYLLIKVNTSGDIL